MGGGTAPQTGSENLPRTLGELRASGHRERSVKAEIRENLLAALADGIDIWPGIFGFEDTVLPQLERALIAGHDFVLLGERGQGAEGEPAWRVRAYVNPWVRLIFAGPFLMALGGALSLSDRRLRLAAPARKKPPVSA